MEPDILVLDEPTADGSSRTQRIDGTSLKTASLEWPLFLVTHLMDDVVNFVDTVYVIGEGPRPSSGQPAPGFQDVGILWKRSS